MITLSGAWPLTSMYFLRALVTAGTMWSVISNTISVHDHPLRRLAIDLDVLPQSLGDGWHHVVSHLAHPVVNVSRRDKPCEVLVEGGHQRACRFVLVQGVMVGVVAQYHGVLHGDVDSPGLTPHLA